MKVITFRDITALNIPPKTYYDWTVEMIKNKNNALLPPKISLKPVPGVFMNVMPSIVESKGGVKVVTRYPERKPSLESRIMLYNIENGECLALLDGDWITAMRTAAVAVHSIMLLAKKNFKTVAFMGLGNIARATLLTLDAIADRELEIRLLRFNKEEELFVKRFENNKNLHFTYYDDATSLVKGSEVVVSCVTYAPEDFCPDDAFDEGVLVVPVHTLGFTNCDLFFDKVFADDEGHVCHFKNYDKFRKFAEVGDVLNGNAVGRENDRERILAYNIGVSVHDINFAAHIYEMIDKNADLQEVSIDGPTEQYWV